MNHSDHDHPDTTEVDLADEESAATLAPPEQNRASSGLSTYTPEACQRFAEGLDQPALERVVVVLEHLFALGSVDEERLADALGLEPVELWGTVTNPVKLHAKSLNLPLPYEVVTVAGESLWEDSLGVAGLLTSVIRDEIDRRHMGEPTNHEDAAPARSADRDRYQKLLDYFMAQPEDESITMGLEEIEAVIGFELPPKAWADGTWWTRDADVPYRHHSRSWRDTGREALPDFENLQIVFEPAAPDHESGVTSDRRLRRFTRALFGRKGAAEPPDAHEAQEAPEPEEIAEEDYEVIAAPVEEDGPASEGSYSVELSAEFASGLSDRALDTAHVLFREFATHGVVDSPTLAELLGCEPASLAGSVAGPLRRRARALDCEPPYRSERGRAGAVTMWLPSPGAMPNMADAIALERARRRA